MAMLKPIAGDDCRVVWQVILMAYANNDRSEIEADWKHLLDCTPNAIDWLFEMFPEREDMAGEAAILYPKEPLAWFWLGEQANQAVNPQRALQYYSETIRLDPANGLAWCRLGNIHEDQEQLQTAMVDYWQCCLNGDRGSNGCYGAGRIAEKLGDIPAAIQYYRHSHWLPALQRADALAPTQ